MQLKCEVRCKKGEREGKRHKEGGRRCRACAHPHPPRPHSRTGKTTFGILSLPPPSVVLPDMVKQKPRRRQPAPPTPQYGVIKEVIKGRRERKRYQVLEEGGTPRSETRGVGDSGKDRKRERDLRDIVSADCHQTQARQRKRQYMHRRPASSHPQHPSREYTKSQKRREG
jgi:hypothetical protein